MARKFEFSLKYFPHDTDMAYDRSVRKLTKRFGAVGYGVFLRILESIYKVGHFVYCSDEFLFDILDSLNMDADDGQLIKDIVGYCAEIGLFDNDMYMLSNVLTSHGIQERYFFAKEQSITRAITKQSLPEYEYLLIDIHNEFAKPNDISEFKKKQEEEPVFIGEEDVVITEPTHEAPILTIVPPADEPKPKAKVTKADAHHANYDWIDPAFHDAFSRYLQYRIDERKGKYKKEATVKVAYNQLVEYSHNDPSLADKIVNNTIAGGWIGLFPLKEQKQNATNQQPTNSATSLVNGLAAISAARRKS